MAEKRQAIERVLPERVVDGVFAQRPVTTVPADQPGQEIGHEVCSVLSVFFANSIDLFLPKGEHAAANCHGHHEIKAVERSEETRLLRDRAGDGCNSERVGIDG